MGTDRAMIRAWSCVSDSGGVGEALSDAAVLTQVSTKGRASEGGFGTLWRCEAGGRDWRSREGVIAPLTWYQ